MCAWGGRKKCVAAVALLFSIFRPIVARAVRVGDSLASQNVPQLERIYFHHGAGARSAQIVLGAKQHDTGDGYRWR